MKHAFLKLLILLSSTASLCAQQIAIDEENANGKFIATNFISICNTPPDFKAELSLGVAYNTAMQTLFCLNLKIGNNTPLLKVSKGSALQLISKDGLIIVLHNTSDIADADPTDNTIIVSYGVQYNEVELANLDQMMNERIVKIKIETDNGIIEKDISDNLFSKSVFQCFNTLKQHLERIKD